MALATPEKIQQFNELGFVSFPEPLCPPSELAALRKRYDEVFAADNDEGRREKGLHFDLGGPSTLDGPPEDIATWTLPQVLTAGTALDELAPTLLANAGAISEALLASEPGWGEPSVLKGAHAIMKPPLVGAATPWHQDDAYASPDEEHRRLSCWVPLQDAGVEDGCKCSRSLCVFFRSRSLKDAAAQSCIGSSPSASSRSTSASCSSSRCRPGRSRTRGTGRTATAR